MADIQSGTDGRVAARPAGFRVRVDDQGRAIPLTPDERQARAEATRLALEAMRAITDEPDEDDAEFFRAIDSHRPDRPLFEGRY